MRDEYPEARMEQQAILTGEMWRHTTANDATCQRSIAISLKRIADLVEEAAKPTAELALLPEGFETVADKRHREWTERMDRAHETDERKVAALEGIADLIARIETRSDETPKSGSARRVKAGKGAKS